MHKLKAVLIALYSRIQLIGIGLNGKRQFNCILHYPTINFSIRFCAYSITCFLIAPIGYQLSIACLLYLVIGQMQLNCNWSIGIRQLLTACMEARPYP